MAGLIDIYVEGLRTALAFDPGLAERACAEVEEHLRDAAAEATDVPANEAERRAIERFGPPSAVAAGFAAALMPHRLIVAWRTAALTAAAVFLTMRLRAVLVPAAAPDGASLFGYAAAVDRYAFLAALILGVAGWLATRGDRGEQTPGRALALLTIAAAALAVSSIAGIAALSVALAGHGWVPPAWAPLAAATAEVGLLACVAGNLRTLRLQAQAALPPPGPA